jgi:Fur family ferric uptake transcriptional regulator
MGEECCQKAERHSEHRQLVLECISAAGGKHLSAEQVYEEVKSIHPGIGVATVYRNLKQLEASGAIVKSLVGDGNGAVYEISGPEGMHSHHHLVCLTCGSVRDLEADLLDSIEKYVENKNGFKVKDHRLQIFGTCKECLEAKPE